VRQARKERERTRCERNEMGGCEWGGSAKRVRSVKAPTVNETGVNRGVGPARRERGSTRTFGSVPCAGVLVSPLHYKTAVNTRGGV